MTALADLALRRPIVVLVAILGVLAATVVVAAGAPGQLRVGAASLDGSGGASQGPGDLVVATTGKGSVDSGPYQVALRVITAQLSSDPGVVSVRRGPVSGDGRSTSLIVALARGDDAADQRSVERIESEIDPGPLKVAYGGQVPTLLEARHDLSHDLWRLELVAIPIVIVALIAVLGPWLAAAPVLCSAIAIAGALAGLRALGEIADLSLLGIAPAAVVGLAIGIETPCLMMARFTDEAASVPHAEAVRRSVAGSASATLPTVAAVVFATAGLLATGLDQAPSMLLASFLAACLAIASALIAVPALLALAGPDSRRRLGSRSGEPRLGAVPRRCAGFLASSRLRAALAGAIAVALMVAAGVPALGGQSRPFSAAELPAGSEAAAATTLMSERPHGGGHGDRAATKPQPVAAGNADDSVFGKLPLAAAVSLGGLALLFSVAFSVRVIAVAVVALLPAAAACGLCVLVVQNGHLAAAIGLQRQGALETGAVASLLAAVASICAARAVRAVGATRGESSLGLGPLRAAEAAAAFTVPAVILATLGVAAAAGALGGSDLYPAREFGFALAAGVIIDLVLVRVPLLAVLSRWGGADS